MYNLPQKNFIKFEKKLFADEQYDLPITRRVLYVNI